MKRLISVLVALVFVGAGCATQPAPEPTPQPVPEDKTIFYVVSSKEANAYCNGGDMKETAYRATLDVVKTKLVSSTLSQEAIAMETLRLATNGNCTNFLSHGNIKIVGTVAHIPFVDGWAGISIAQCRCRPEIEVNLLRVPGVVSVVWDERITQ